MDNLLDDNYHFVSSFFIPSSKTPTLMPLPCTFKFSEIVEDTKTISTSKCFGVSDERFEVIANALAMVMDDLCENEQDINPCQILLSLEQNGLEIESPNELVFISYMLGRLIESYKYSTINPLLLYLSENDKKAC